jgi:hypothetical protein
VERQGLPFWCVRHMRLFTKAQSKDRVRGDGGRDGFPPPAAVRLNGESDEKRQGSLQVWVLRATGVQGLGLGSGSLQVECIRVYPGFWVQIWGGC